jgi:hypothetical protein
MERWKRSTHFDELSFWGQRQQPEDIYVGALKPGKEIIVKLQRKYFSRGGVMMMVIFFRSIKFDRMLDESRHV